MVESAQDAKRPLARSQEGAARAGKGTVAAAAATARFVGGTGKALWGPIMGLLLIAAGIGLAWGATATLMELYEGDEEMGRADMIDRVREAAMPFYVMAGLLVAGGITIIAVDIYGKHVRDGMLGRRA